MRALVSRGLLLPPLVCAALVLGPVGVATAAEVRPGTPDARATEPRLPGTDMTPERLRTVADTEQGDAFAPLLTVLADLTGLVGGGQGGTLDAAVAAEQAQAVKETTALLQQQLRDTADATTPEDTVTDPAPFEGTTSADSMAPVGSAADAPGRDTATDLETSVDSLVSSLAALDIGGIVGTVPKVLSSVLGLLTGGSGGGLPQLSTPPTT
ncbi:hypothetical protein QFZ75_000687 [Streptomyces sp. V3I8]|uniref:hypothetical protein n=1 Tax=Streptomyces sp. V3I8 TaxID=3042279 RepID=UPI002782665A|nr:hypothetical protein [Streptomyces sp. V3I8]MDQ1034271.1 hypothetical protein [Streptomyces sp. V3I8]